MSVAPKGLMVMVLTEDHFFLSHFKERARAAKDSGFSVCVIANDTGAAKRIQAEGFGFVDVPFKRGSINPIHELRTLRLLSLALQNLGPTIIHNVALKPILYGTLAARGVGRILNAPVGMGFVYTSRSVKARVLRPLLTLALRVLLNPRGSLVVVENHDDFDSLAETGLADPANLRLIRGSGVDTSLLHPVPSSIGPVVVTMAARLLWDKGVGEFVEAAKALRATGAVFWLVGKPDPQNPSSVAESTLREWQRAGIVEWLGFRDDMSEVLAQSHIACLPSYREGLPKSLLEAMAAGLPIVTTDVPGCRECVRDGENGLLVPARDSIALTAALAKLIDDGALRLKLGAAGRRRAEREFSVARVTTETLTVYEELLGNPD